VLVLRYIYVLALVVWLGGMIVLGAVVAPTIFQVLQATEPATGRALAGEAFGAMVARFHYVAYVAGAALLLSLTAMALLGPRPSRFAIRMALAATMLAVAIYSGVGVLGEIDRIQAAVGTLPSSLAAGDARRLRFDALHVRSTRLMSLNVILALLLLGWEARER
jgi:uncharacterized membrane protein